MAALAMLIPMATGLPLTSPAREVEEWQSNLPAAVRAELSWNHPLLQQALDELLAGPLELSRLDIATRQIGRVLIGCKSYMRWILREGMPVGGLFAALREQLLPCDDFLVSPDLVDQMNLCLRVFKRKVEINLEILRSAELSELEEGLADIEAAVESTMLFPELGFSRVSALLMAVFHARAKGYSPELAGELARLCLIMTVEAVESYRQIGIDLRVEQEETPQQIQDRALISMGKLALLGEEWSEGAGGWVRGLAPPLSFSEPAAIEMETEEEERAPRVRTRIERHVGELLGVAFGEHASVTLSIEGVSWCFAATPEIVERACKLGGGAIEALILEKPSGEQTWAIFNVQTKKLLRLDRPGESAPDEATRTRDMIRDWDELLHRLAR